MVLLTANTVEKMIKMAMFDEGEASIPVYEEKSTIVESITTMVAKIKIKTSEVFLLREIAVM